MKTKILLLFLLGWVEIVLGQENQIKKKCVVTIPHYDVITEAKNADDTLKVKGFIGDEFKENCKIVTPDFVYTNTTWGWRQVSLVTVPIKIRPNISGADSGLDNVGVNFDFIYYERDRYFATGGNSTHRFGAGMMLAPLVQELTSDNTTSKSEKGKQFFLSTGLALSYSYNKILFTLVPFGFDFGFNKNGKDWVNNGKYWWGFGIGADLKILEKVLD
ncbi:MULTISPECIES: hypothetical protein [unclassified Chryseobacterium]|uniref:hypothetical protein n=1 Tax=unclassified Chryseobacterium TaxID=2593645 RepID=UPI00100A8CEC|nr:MULTISPECIES: hypothetical protein [unclassified Chryseobacterium]RXM52629.1 hypothetical protein BOQ64_07165 [Chryseobacterium sp. CH25]RXM66685.1 hypothetical protein BOQ60_01640 [Chryseobacterium sp. CH1]